MSDADISIDEKRVYGAKTGASDVYLASAAGVIRVSVSGDRIGGFGLAHRCVARDVAAGGEVAAAATDDGVALSTEEGEFDDVGFGPAAAVGLHEGHVVAAAPEGRVARLDPVDGGGVAWTDLGTVEDPRAVDGGLVAAADGVHRVVGDDLASAGLSDVRDVAVDGAPLAAADDGLYRLGNGWLRERDGRFAVVGASHDRAHAATAEHLYAREDGDWVAVDLPVAERVAGVAYGECPYVVTERGTFLVDADPERTPDGTGGWRKRSLGLPDVTGLAVLA